MHDVEDRLSALHRRSKTAFIALLVAVSLVPAVIAAYLPGADRLDAAFTARYGAILPLLALILAPIVETLLLQYLPAQLVRRWHAVGIFRVIVITLPFTLLHLSNLAISASLVNGFGGAYILGMCYLVCARKSDKHAVAMTASVHFLHNGLMLAASAVLA